MLILYPPGEQFIVGSSERTCSRSWLQLLEELASAPQDQAPELARLPLINTEKVTLDTADEWRHPVLGNDSMSLAAADAAAQVRRPA